MSGRQCKTCKKGSRRCLSDRKCYKKSFRKYRTTTGRKCVRSRKCNDNKCHKKLKPRT